MENGLIQDDDCTDENDSDSDYTSQRSSPTETVQQIMDRLAGIEDENHVISMFRPWTEDDYEEAALSASLSQAIQMSFGWDD